jgi:ribosomal protein L34E
MFGRPVIRIPGGSIKSPRKPFNGPKCPSCGRPISSARLVYDSQLKRTTLRCPCGHKIS